MKLINRGICAGLLALSILAAGNVYAGAAERAARAEAAMQKMKDHKAYSKLDVDGEMLVYLSADNVVQPIREEFRSVLAAVLKELPDEGENAQIKMVAEQIDPVLEWLGLYSIHGLGMSLAQQPNGSYSYKEHLMADTDRDYAMWKLAGKPVEPKLLEYLPENTAAFGFSAVGINTLWDTALEGIEKFGGKQAKEAVLQQVADMRDLTGIDVNAVLQSLNDEWMVGMLLDPSTQIKIPLDAEESISFPEPGMLIAMNVEDDTIVKTITAFMDLQGMPVKETTMGESIIVSIPVPVPVPIPMEPAITVIDNDLLLFASHPSVIKKALASKQAGGGMLQSATFKSDFNQMPEKINGAFYSSKLFSQTAIDLQKNIFGIVGEEALQGAEGKMVLGMISKLAAKKDNYLATHSVVDDRGIFTHCNMYTSGMNPIAEFITGQLSALPAAFALMTENQSKEIHSEARAGCGTTSTVLRMLLAENNGSFPTAINGPATNLEGLDVYDLGFSYFDAADYVISDTKAGENDYTITCTGTPSSGSGQNQGKAAGIVLTLDQNGDESITGLQHARPAAFPSMTANRSKAMSSEAFAGCGTVATVLRIQQLEDGGVFRKSYNGSALDLLGISETDLNGTYFDTADYVVSGSKKGSGTFIITCTGTSTSGRGPNKGKTEGIIVTLDQDGNDSFTINK